MIFSFRAACKHVLHAALFLVPALCAAQDVVASNPYAARLSNEWKLAQLQTHEGMQAQSLAVEFRLLLTPDGIMQQGLYPEGMVTSRWHYDPVRETIDAVDPNAHARYTLRVLCMRRDALTLESNDGERTIMYYVLLHQP